MIRLSAVTSSFGEPAPCYRPSPGLVLDGANHLVGAGDDLVASASAR